jgi:Zn-dependent M28 family amino/carboxypeptidase
MKTQRICFLWIFLLSVSLLATGSLRDRVANISRAEMQSVVEFLGHHLLEGRAPGTRGGDLAEIYMRSLFKFSGFKPGMKGRYFQPFKLKGYAVKELACEANRVPLKYGEDIMGTVISETGRFELEGDAVFVGFGIDADLWNWHDYKNADVKGRVVIARVNDPGMYRPDIFEGSVLTYFGRWTYHIEEAARRGAAGILLIHTDASAGYNWQVVKNSWSGEEVFLKSDVNNNLKFRAWIRESSLRRILDAVKVDLDTLYKKSLRRKFKPVPLGFQVKVKGLSTYREVLNRNVIAEIPGKSPKRVVLSAHIDHLGMAPDQPGDNIYNGAIDNGSAVAAMMVTARILQEFQQELYYTVTVLACQAEEAGLLGSRYYVRHTDRENIAANINFESTPVWERTTDFMGVGARFSTLEDMLKEIVEKEGLTYAYFSMSNQGFFYRSDQFSFARYNIPAIWISAGENDVSGRRKYPHFWQTDYHTVRDEYNPDWPLESMKQTIQMAVMLVDHLNRTRILPRWKRKLTFPTIKETPLP